MLLIDTERITELDVEALIDSQLDWEKEKRVLRELERNPGLRAYHEEMVKQKKLLVAWWRNTFCDRSGRA